jgi:hypothetical protein
MFSDLDINTQAPAALNEMQGTAHAAPTHRGGNPPASRPRTLPLVQRLAVHSHSGQLVAGHGSAPRELQLPQRHRLRRDRRPAVHRSAAVIRLVGGSAIRPRRVPFLAATASAFRSVMSCSCKGKDPVSESRSGTLEKPFLRMHFANSRPRSGPAAASMPHGGLCRGSYESSCSPPLTVH